MRHHHAAPASNDYCRRIHVLSFTHATDGDGVLTRGPRARETREKIRRTINYNFVLIIGRTAIGTRVGVVRLYCRESTNRPKYRLVTEFFHPYFPASAPRLQTSTLFFFLLKFCESTFNLSTRKIIEMTVCSFRTRIVRGKNVAKSII